MTLQEYYTDVGKCSYCMFNVIKHLRMHSIVGMYVDAKEAHHVRLHKGVK